MTAFKYAAALVALTFVNSAMGQQTQQTQPAINQAQNQAEAARQRADQAAQRQQNQANQRNQAGQIGQAGQAGQAGQQHRGQGSSDMNTVIASCLLLGNQEEVALAQLAAERAESEQVKQFAQMLIEDHQQAIQKLQPLAKPGIGLSEGRQAASSSQSPNAQQYTANRQDLSRDAGSPATVEKILQLDQQATQACLDMTRQMLEEKQGAEFDEAFTGMQIGAHVGMLAQLKASEQHASGELASLIKQSQQTVKGHLDQAKQIYQGLEGQSADGNSRQVRSR